MSKEEAQEAVRKINNIIEQWTENRLDANSTLELLLPLLETVISYFEKEETPGEEKKSLYEDLEKDLDKEDGDPPLFSRTQIISPSARCSPGVARLNMEERMKFSMDMQKSPRQMSVAIKKNP